MLGLLGLNNKLTLTLCQHDVTSKKKTDKAIVSATMFRSTNETRRGLETGDESGRSGR